MPDVPVYFDRPSAEAIARVVRAFRPEVRDRIGKPIRPLPLSDVTTFPAAIGAATQDGTNKRWSYAITEVEKTGAGYAGWTTKAEGITGTAFNGAEYVNGATGTFGNGVSSTNLVGTIDIQPVTSGIIVFVHTVAVVGGGDEYWFSFANGVDGACP